MKEDRVGEKYITNQGYEVEIIEYNNSLDVKIVFNNSLIKHVSLNNLRKGEIKNPYHPTIYGVGYFGEGGFKASELGKNTKYYSLWVSMIKRCYNEKEQEKCPTYKGCSVAEEWHNFQNFGNWFVKTYKDGFSLDKDILIKGNKIYSPETCCFVPPEINTLFLKKENSRGEYPIGVSKRASRFASIFTVENKTIHLGTFDTPEEAFEAYKTVKEKRVKQVADKWKDLIDPRVYQAMYNYKVEITD